ncbi:MAG: DUF4160 domain-containing protein [Verrucomicrobiota bacterium]
MPTVLRIGSYRFNFFSKDRKEPPHIHIRAGENEAKFWLNPIQLVVNHGFKPHEINDIKKIVEENQTLLLDAWKEYFNGN